ncbi:MAG: homoserine dehydrogenase [Polyangiaceae bacterium]|nr:homoserine dehydrogenase [Polyangiaceae bacterium]MCW5791552.1 homoserine dehydrogenase [Polyangiaceae bacterium]
MAERVKFPIRIALLGCGTVGGGVIRLMEDNAAYLASRVGAELCIRHVLVRDAERDRVPECRREWLTTDPEVVLGDPEIDLVVEVIGGADPARSYLERAIDAGKGVVTANKLLLAQHGPELVRRAGRAGVDLAFEASVGGGVPVIRTLREALTSDWVRSVHAILNGTCNYVLTRMRDDGVSFDDAVKEAQRLGYAEADPSLDVDGHDAAQKLVVLSMLAFGADVPVSGVKVEGIGQVDQLDFRFAARFGYTIKHLAIGHDHGERIELRVHPAMIPRGSVLANIDGVLNATLIQGRALGPCLLVGRGAGDMPTAVSVVADIVDVARSRMEGEPGLSTRGIQLNQRPLLPHDEVQARYYLRFDVADEPGVLGHISTALGAHGVSIEQMMQEGRAEEVGSAVPVLIITHGATEGRVTAAMQAVAGHGFMKAPPRLIRIEDV